MLVEVGKKGEGQSQWLALSSPVACFCLSSLHLSSLSHSQVCKLDGAQDRTERMIGQKLEMEDA